MRAIQLVCHFGEIDSAYEKGSDVHRNLSHAQQVLVSIYTPPSFFFLPFYHNMTPAKLLQCLRYLTRLFQIYQLNFHVC